MTIPVPAAPSARMVALKWLSVLIPDLQAGKSLLTPVESWADDVFCTVHHIPSVQDQYVPIRDEMIQFDIWGRPSPSQQYRGLPHNRCDAIVEYLYDNVVHFNPLRIDFSMVKYADVELSDAYLTEKSASTADRPQGATAATGAATVALSRARLTACFVYKIVP